jgi:uncharacterized membrane protein
MLPVLIATHIALALALLVPSILLPFALRSRTASGEPRGFTRALMWVQRDFSLWIGIGLAFSGAALLVVVGPDLISRPWLVVALVLYVANLVVAFVVQRPALRRLLGLRSDASEAERERWRDRARRQRYLSYVMAMAIGLIAFLMTTKPEL